MKANRPEPHGPLGPPDGSAAAISRRSAELPLALDALEAIEAAWRGRRLVIFLDYDGTLTPIVSHPELARLSQATRDALRALAQRCTVVVMSGRDLADVRARVGLCEIVYGGSHGFEICDPQTKDVVHPQGTEFLPRLDQAEQALRRRLAPIAGLLVERKKFSIAVHFRLVAIADLPAVEPAVDAVVAASAGLRKTGGKQLFEVRPDISWDKGRAMLWLLERLGLTTSEGFVLYLGDDLTDEDAFRALRVSGHGPGILVREAECATQAHYALDGPAQVQLFLEQLLRLIPPT